MIHCDKYESPAGTLWLTGNGHALTALSFSPPEGPDRESAVSGEFEMVKRWLDDYFRGEPSAPDFPMKPAGTAFQQQIWALLLKIPYGQTCTYGQLAKQAAQMLGKEKMSAQAVGQAVGCNPIAIVIPCHRVVGAGGKLTGYAYGIEKKQWLLDREQNRR